jgi:hypothetical protein
MRSTMECVAKSNRKTQMKPNARKIQSLIALCAVALPFAHPTSAAEPYKVLDTTQLMGNGGIDYVYAESEGRRVYVPRGGQTFVFDLDSHKLVGSITNISGHGVAIGKTGRLRLARAHMLCHAGPLQAAPVQFGLHVGEDNARAGGPGLAVAHT